jgi:hypothetical protein
LILDFDSSRRFCSEFDAGNPKFEIAARKNENPKSVDCLARKFHHTCTQPICVVGLRRMRKLLELRKKDFLRQ